MDSRSPRTVVLGAGPAGLGAAWTFVEAGDRNVEMLELQDRVGGLAGTFERDGYHLDYGPHKFYTRFDYLLEKMKALMGADLLTVPKRSGVWLQGRRLEYPINARDLLLGLSPPVAFRCGMSYALVTLRNMFRARPDVSYEDYIVNRFGRSTYELVFAPLATKIWGDPQTLDAGLARVRVVMPSLMEMLVRMVLGDRGKREISAKEFYYPRQGFQEFWDRIRHQIEQADGGVHLEAKPTAITLENNRVTSATFDAGVCSETFAVGRMVSTIPLASLLGLLTPAPPSGVLEAAAALRYRAAVLLFIVANRPRLSTDAWIFFPEARYIFNRISEQKAFSPEMIPSDRTVVTVDITVDLDGDVWRMSDEEVFDKVMDGLEHTGLLRRTDTSDYFTVRIPRVYPVYDLQFRPRMEQIWEYLDGIPNLISAGRHGYFQHNNSDNALDMGIQAARHLLADAPSTAWEQQRQQFDTYQIVD